LEKLLLHNKILVPFILLAFLVQSFSSNLIILDYYTNTSAYALRCENKARPMMHCNGKCQMMKKMQQEEKREQENSERRMENKNEWTLSSDSFFGNGQLQTSLQLKTNVLLPINIGFPIDRNDDIFHPPA
jgi:hypothetical protein